MSQVLQFLESLGRDRAVTAEDPQREDEQSPDQDPDDTPQEEER